MIQDDKEISIEIQKKALLWFLAITVIGAFIFCMMYDCSNKKPIVTTLPIPLEAKKLKEVERITFELGIEKNKTDSLTKVKSIVTHHYHTVYDSVYIQSDSVCRASLLITHNECLKLDSVNTHIIHGQETQLIKYSEVVNDYKDVISLKNYTHSVDSINIIGLNDEIKHQKKRVIKAKVGSVLIGILSAGFGFGVGKVMP